MITDIGYKLLFLILFALFIYGMYWANKLGKELDFRRTMRKIKQDIKNQQTLDKMYGLAYSEILDDDAKSAAKKMRKGKY